MQQKIRRVAVSELKRPPFLPRLRVSETAHLISKSIDTFGIIQTPTWNEHTGHLLSLHSVVEALRDRGENEVDVLVVNIPATLETVAMFALNNHEHDWDWEHVAAELKTLKLAGVDLRLTGFTEAQFTALSETGEWIPPEPTPLDGSAVGQQALL